MQDEDKEIENTEEDMEAEQPASPEELRSQRQQYLERAHEYKKWGGIIPYLMKNYAGVRDFVNEDLLKNGLPSDVFLDKLLKQFPEIPQEHWPSLNAVNTFRKKMNEEDDVLNNRYRTIALKDEVRTKRAFGNLNVVEERMDLYLEAAKLTNEGYKALEPILALMDRTKLPPDILWTALGHVSDLIKKEGEQLDEVDKLAVRFGYMPPKREENIINVLQQNNTILVDEEQRKKNEQMMKDLEITDADFHGWKHKTTKKKIMKYLFDKIDAEPDDTDFELSPIYDANEPGIWEKVDAEIKAKEEMKAAWKAEQEKKYFNLD